MKNEDIWSHVHHTTHPLLKPTKSHSFKVSVILVYKKNITWNFNLINASLRTYHTLGREPRIEYQRWKSIDPWTKRAISHDSEDHRPMSFLWLKAANWATPHRHSKVQSLGDGYQRLSTSSATICSTAGKRYHTSLFSHQSFCSKRRILSALRTTDLTCWSMMPWSWIAPSHGTWRVYAWDDQIASPITK